MAIHHQSRTPSRRRSEQTLAATQPAPAPKLDVFPTPQPLTPEEHTLVAIAAQAPAPLRKALVEAQLQPGEPLRIAAISIPPIKPPDQVQP
jgi:hypothetical protein